MSQITIQCRLVASEPTRHQVWKLMADKNTPLINELLARMQEHPDFDTWRQKGKLPDGIVEQLCKPLKTDSRFIGQPTRFYKSAIDLVEYIYKSWLALQQRLQRQLEGQTRWLGMLKSDAELIEASGCSLDAIRTKAAVMLAQFAAQCTPAHLEPCKGKKGKKTKKTKNSNTALKLSDILFEVTRETEDVLSCCAIIYLIKNGCKVSDKEEEPEKFTKRRRSVEIRVYRLQEQLASRIPKGRDLTSAKWLETLSLATTTVPPSVAEARSWQASLLRKSKSVPFPIVIKTNEEMVWSKNQKGRLCVEFSGLGEHTFKLYCDRRQQHLFERFLEDQQIKSNGKQSGKYQHSSGLFTLRSGILAWQEGEEKGDPWNVHHLTLFCTIDTRLWTDEGTEQVRQEKAADIAKVITGMKNKGNLSKTQEAFVKRQQSTLARINNPFPRPSKPLYQGQPHILVGVSLGLDKPATAAVLDATTSTVLTYRSIRQLLGDNYKLLNRQRQQQQRNSHQRHKAQRQDAPSHFFESELGQYVDRLLAQAIVTLAIGYQAGSIVLPKVGDVREIVESEVQSRAEQKCPGYLEGQKEYAKQYRSSVHYWSYGRLIENIQSQAAKAGIAIESAEKQIRGSPQEKARDLALSAYQSRKLP